MVSSVRMICTRIRGMLTSPKKYNDSSIQFIHVFETITPWQELSRFERDEGPHRFSHTEAPRASCAGATESSTTCLKPPMID